MDVSFISNQVFEIIFYTVYSEHFFLNLSMAFHVMTMCNYFTLSGELVVNNLLDFVNHIYESLQLAQFYESLQLSRIQIVRNGNMLK